MEHFDSNGEHGMSLCVTDTAAGVSNFHLDELVELVHFASIPPAVIQGHSDPFTQSLSIRRFAWSLGIQYTAYSSLGTQYLRRNGGSNPVLQNPAICCIGDSLGSSAAQVQPCQPIAMLASAIAS